MSKVSPIPLLETINPDLFKGYLTPEEFKKELKSKNVDITSGKFKELLKQYTGKTSVDELSPDKIKFFRDQTVGMDLS